MRARSWLYACALLDGLEILLFMKYRIHAWVPVLDLDILWAAEFVLWV